MIKALAFIHKKKDLSDDDFKNYYEKNHAPLAISLLTFEGYERNFVDTKINPLFASLGSISIFQYQSIESLNYIEEQMSSDAGDILREDELKFMDVAKNYFVLTQSNQLTELRFKKKIFYPSNDIESLNSLNSYESLKKISDNIILDSTKMVGIAEYGITEEATFDDLEKLTQEHPKAIITSCVY
tara:strand:- start:2231 stop:2785 length:555 start_codon:yes stop_codon:yes gene_type:complete